MSRRTAVIGLLAITAMIVAAMVFLLGSLDDHPGTLPSGASSSSEAPYVPCASCDARHQRLGRNRPGED